MSTSLRFLGPGSWLRRAREGFMPLGLGANLQLLLRRRNLSFGTSLSYCFHFFVVSFLLEKSRLYSGACHSEVMRNEVCEFSETFFRHLEVVPEIKNLNLKGICFTFQQCFSRAGMNNRTRVVVCRLRPQLSSLVWSGTIQHRNTQSEHTSTMKQFSTKEKSHNRFKNQTQDLSINRRYYH